MFTDALEDIGCLYQIYHLERVVFEILTFRNLFLYI